MNKTTDRKYRLRSAKDWIKTFSGSNIVNGCSKKYSVDKLCTVKELRMIGLEIPEEYERQLVNSMEAFRQQRLSARKKKEDELNAEWDFERNDNFAMIPGYTS